MDNCCKDVVEALGDRVSLAPEDEQIVAAHLAACANCRAMDSGLSAIPALLRRSIDQSLDAISRATIAQDALGFLVATADQRARETLRQSLTPEDEAALHPNVELLKKG